MKLTKRIISWMLALVLLLSVLPTAVFAKGNVMYGIGFTTGSDLRLREKPNTTSKIVDISPKDEVVVVIEKSGDWYHVIYNLQEGYMHKDYVSVLTAQNAELGYGKVTGNDVNMRSGPGTNFKSVTTGDKGDKVYIIGLNNGWYKVIFNNRICYIRSDFVELTEIPYENDESGKSPLFFRGGMSTGVAPSPDALKDNGGSNTDTGKEDPKPTEAPQPTEAPKPTEDPKTDSSTKDDGLVDGIAFVNATDLLLRGEPSTKGKVLSSADRNEVVVVLSKHGDWYKVNYNLKEGYMHGSYLKVQSTGHAELGYGRITGTGVNLRSGAGTSHSVVAVGNRGSSAYILGVENGWYRVIYGQNICYIRSDFLSLTQAPYENPASPNSPKFYRGGKSTGTEPSAAALNGSSSSNSGNNNSGSQNNSGKLTGQQVVDFAKRFLGTPYKWGGTTPAGFDCSGFVYYVYNSLGYPLSRMITGMNSTGVYVPKSELQPGDIVIFQNTYASGLSHVGIYVGDGKFIHSPNSRSVVSIADLNSSYYTSHYYGARRIVTN